MESIKSKQNFTAWAIVAIIGLLGLNAYQWFSNSQLKTQNVAQLTQVEDLTKAQAELDQDYQAALESLEQLRGDNKELNELIDSQKNELETQKAKISDLIWSKRELGKAKEEMKVLKAQAEQYVAQINKLTEENQFLSSENTNLSTQNQSLATNLESERIAKEEIAQARAILASEKEGLSKTNETLSSKVDMANAIKVNFMEVTGFEVKGNGKLDKESKAKNVDLLRFCIKTETNLVTPAGKKKFYVRVISPTGETVAVEDSGSGVLTNKLDNTQIRYSTSGDVEYNNTDTNACIDWTLAQAITKGMYDVEIYNNGFIVGKGNFKLK
ncbi:MAG TPA: hypothetical protein PKD18_13500 [Saprospiraceae bacterium]|nr:hypothetical protein [Saprospiraceae bacterium]